MHTANIKKKSRQRCIAILPNLDDSQNEIYAKILKLSKALESDKRILAAILDLGFC